MTPEETIRNLINRSGPRKGTGRILTERSWFEVDVETARNQQISSNVNPEKIKQKAKEEDREKEKAELDQARAEQNRAKQAEIKYDAPRSVGPTTSVVKHEGPPTPPAPEGQAKDTNVQTPQEGSAETPEQKAESDAKETESSVPNPRAAGGGLQIGSSLNTSNLQATQQRFIRGPLNNSYDPFDARKSFIREFVIRIVETEQVPEKAVDRARRKQEEKKHKRGRARFKTGLQTGEVVAPPRITLEPRSIMDLFKNPL